MKLKVLIVDDEALSRERMRRFLANEHDTTVVGECASGTEALKEIRSHAPDILFLDVRMPELDGFGVLRELRGSYPPAIIFVTAHDEFALQAFEFHAVDYLLKPFDRRRFRTALSRARERLQRRDGSQAESTGAHSAAAQNRDSLGCVPIRSSGRIRLLRWSDIDWISAADNYAELHAGATTHLLRSTLTQLSHRLVNARFVQISRSILVNSDRVTEMRPKSHGDYLIILRDGTSLAGSRKYRKSLAQFLGNTL